MLFICILLINLYIYSVDVRLKKFGAEKKELQDEIRHLRLELEEAKSRLRSERSSGSVLGRRIILIIIIK